MTYSMFATVSGVPQPFTSFVAQPSGTTYETDARGFLSSVAAGDQGSLSRAGCLFAQNFIDTYSTSPVVPAAAAPAAYVSSVALTNGSLTIAAQPEVPRQVAVVVGSAAAITAGTLSLSYTASDGTAQTDSLSLVTAGSGTLTLTTTKGVAKLTSAVVAGVTGGSSPYIFAGSNATLALPVPIVSSGLSLVLEQHGAVNSTPGTVTPNGLWTPSVAPNGTLTFGAYYSYIGA